MDVDEQTPANVSNSVIISNLPSQNKDEEDVETLLYVGLCLDVGEVKIKNISCDEEKHSRPGNLTVEFENLDQKIKVLSRKRRLNLTNEYTEVYIRAVKTHNELVMERNFSKVLQSLPTHNFILASNGKIVNRFCNEKALRINVWNIHGLNSWKLEHIDFVNILNSSDILILIET